MKHWGKPPSSDDRAWRSDPALRGRFHPQCPDDLEGLLFFPLARQVERVWIRLESVDAAIGGYAGQLLNTPHAPPAQHGSVALAAGKPVGLRVTPGSKDPIVIPPDVRANLLAFRGACEACGWDLLLEAAESVWRRQFPDAPAGASPVAFTTRCAMCGGTQALEAT